jgi:hypothetical protein
LCTEPDLAILPVPLVAPFVPVVSDADPLYPAPQATINKDAARKIAVFLSFVSMSCFFCSPKFTQSLWQSRYKFGVDHYEIPTIFTKTFAVQPF